MKLYFQISVVASIFFCLFLVLGVFIVLDEANIERNGLLVSCNVDSVYTSNYNRGGGVSYTYELSDLKRTVEFEVTLARKLFWPGDTVICKVLIKKRGTKGIIVYDKLWHEKHWFGISLIFLLLLSALYLSYYFKQRL